MKGALSPLGAVAARLGVSTNARTPYPEGLVKEAEAVGLEEGAIYLAWEMVERVEGGTPREREALVTLVAASLAWARQGGFGLPLGRLEERFAALGADSALATVAKAVLEAGVLGAEILCGPEGDAPLVERDGRLYWAHDLGWHRWVSEELERRLTVQTELSDFTRLLDALDDVLARPAILNGTPLRLSSDQQHAVRAAATRPMTLLDGVPRSGKTAVLVSLLRVLARLDGSLRGIAIAARSEREARLVGASIRRSLEAVSDPGREDLALAASLPEPVSLNRLLSLHGAPRSVFLMGASTIELDALGRLLGSLERDVRLVLFGGGRPRPGVPAGPVLARVLVSSGSVITLRESFPRESRDAAERNLQRVGRHLLEVNAEALFHPESRADESIAVRNGVEDVRFQGVELVESDRERWLDRWRRELLHTPEVRDIARRTFRLPLDESDAEAIGSVLFQLTRHVVLTLSERDARFVNRALRRTADVHPVVCLRGDASRGLAEGDVGVLLGGRAFFPEREGLVAHEAEALADELALAYALPIERMPPTADHVALWLPEDGRGRLDRAGLLAALRTAGRSLTILGPRESVIAAVGRDDE